MNNVNNLHYNTREKTCQDLIPNFWMTLKTTPPQWHIPVMVNQQKVTKVPHSESNTLINIQC